MKSVWLMAALALGSACNKNKLSGRGKHGADEPAGKAADETTKDGDPAAGEQGPGGNSSSVNDSTQAGLTLVWKRYRALEHGLANGLGLTAGQLCKELGKHSCVDKVHLAVLGGNEPFETGTYERAAAPTALTALAVDRVVLSACSQRLALDQAAGTSAVVFKHFPLTGTVPAAAAVEAQAKDLFRRLLARDPEAGELTAVAAFAKAAKAPEKLALGLCLAIGSMAESVFL